MTDQTTTLTPTQERLAAAYDGLSDAALTALRTQAGETCNTYLLTFKDPKNYGEFRHMAATLADSMAAWLIAEEWVTPAPKAVATKAELAGRSTPAVAPAAPSRGVRNPGYTDGGYA